MKERLLASVAIPLPVSEPADYVVPERARASIRPGMRVEVPYGRRELTGMVVTLRPEPAPPARKLRAIRRVVDAQPVLPESLIRVVLQAAHDSLSPPGVALSAAVPPGTAPRPGRSIGLRAAGRSALESGSAPAALGAAFSRLEGGPMPEPSLLRRFPELEGRVDQLIRLGWLGEETEREPARVRPRTERVYRLDKATLLEVLRDRLARAPRQLEIVDRLARAHADGDDEIPLASSASLRALLGSGAVAVREREVMREVGPGLAPGLPQDERPTLTSAQRAAVDALEVSIDQKRAETYVLYGITGSGKTEVYLHAAEHALARQRGVIVLVPEISLTHQVVDRFRARFGDGVIAVLHSGLSPGERYDQWRRIRSGAFQIAIGARSAVFAPFEDVGLVVIDEEHDGAYKSDEGFRFHARDVAELRARAHGCPVVLGSATPDVVTAYRAQQREIPTLVLPERVASRPLPSVEIIDMEQEKRSSRKFQLLSRALRQTLAETVANRQQAILFVNRRGFATHVYCFACGHGLRCKHCDISLVYHATDGPRRTATPEQGELRCHYCGYREDPSPVCPACESADGGLLGFGTERVHEEVAAMFPHARVARLDRDTSARRGAQRKILAAFHRGETDVLVGTQMVAKGHDVPNVTLVGVIAADIGLHFPDYRAGERTFQLLTQVAGRAGRGADPGRVIVQTFLPDHYAIALARTHDYRSFFRAELERRRPHGYPPFGHVVQIALQGEDPALVEATAGRIAEAAQREHGGLLAEGAARGEDRFEVLGPAPAPLAKVRDRYRWQLLLMGGEAVVKAIGRQLLRSGPARTAGVQVRVVADPVQML